MRRLKSIDRRRSSRPWLLALPLAVAMALLGGAVVPASTPVAKADTQGLDGKYWQHYSIQFNGSPPERYSGVEISGDTGYRIDFPNNGGCLSAPWLRNISGSGDEYTAELNSRCERYPYTDDFWTPITIRKLIAGPNLDQPTIALSGVGVSTALQGDPVDTFANSAIPACNGVNADSQVVDGYQWHSVDSCRMNSIANQLRELALGGPAQCVNAFNFTGTLASFALVFGPEVAPAVVPLTGSQFFMSKTCSDRQNTLRRWAEEVAGQASQCAAFGLRYRTRVSSFQQYRQDGVVPEEWRVLEMDNFSCQVPGGDPNEHSYSGQGYLSAEFFEYTDPFS